MKLFTVSYKRLPSPYFRKLHLILFMLILYGIATYFLRDHVWNAIHHVLPRNPLIQTSTNKMPSRKLIFLQILFRHGHHSPFTIYPRDPIPSSHWPEGLGQLTKLGRLQHYAVGKYLQRMYESFLSHNVQEVDCMSSIADRSLYAAYAFLAGFYPAPPSKRMENDLPYQPIACSYLPLEEDMYLQSLPNCPASEFDKSTIIKTREAKEFMEGYQDLYVYWSSNSGLRIENYETAGNLYKTLLAEKTENLTIPKWAERTWESLKKNNNICYHLNFKTRLLHRLTAGSLIGEIIGKMKTRIQNPKSKLKVYVYSGHGSNVAAVFNALRVFNHCVPPYASAFLFELYQEELEGHTVRLLLSNATEPEKYISPPHVLQLPGCGEYCPLEELERQTADLFPLDWKKECQKQDPNRIEQLINE